MFTEVILDHVSDQQKFIFSCNLKVLVASLDSRYMTLSYSVDNVEGVTDYPTGHSSYSATVAKEKKLPPRVVFRALEYSI